jgi:hypothetical protein
MTGGEMVRPENITERDYQIEYRALKARHSQEAADLRVRHFNEEIALCLEFPDDPDALAFLEGVRMHPEGAAAIEAIADELADNESRELVNSLLAGTYSEEGIERWWNRPRQPLGGLSPNEIWAADPRAVIEQARFLADPQ